MDKAGDETDISCGSRQMERSGGGEASELQLRRDAARAALKQALIGLAKAKRRRHAEQPSTDSEDSASTDGRSMAVGHSAPSGQF